ncbi:MAG: apolipoprotein N-acyltransferase [Gammaproteobacteria bacterium]|nr:apolipoprotein N-acyltransferase [Gammaproteobacteria bacterium]
MNALSVLKNISQHRWHADILALSCGALTTLAFAPFYLFPISLVTLSLLFYLWLNSSVNKAFRHGYLFGVGLFATGVSWVYVSMSKFGGVPPALAIFLTALLVLFLALFPAIAGAVFRRFFHTNNLNKSWIIILPSLFVLFEWIRGWIFTGFPWLLIGYSQLDSPLIGFAPVMGVYGLSWIALICSALITYILCNGKPALKFGLVALFTIYFCGALLDLVEWTQPKGNPLNVTLIQGNVSQDKKWLAEQRQPTIDLYTKLTRENWSSDLIIWPETALPAFYHQAKGFLDRLHQEARQTNTDLLIGLPFMDDDGVRYYNGVISLGKQQDVYHKQHMVPFGEYIPFKALLGDVLKILNVPLPNFSQSDNTNRILRIANHQVGISICYEDAFGEEAILALPDVDLLVNVSNDAWFGDSIAPHQHLQIAQMRAIETGRPLLRATNTGVTAIIDHNGHIQSKLPQFVAQALSGATQPMSGSTPYSMVGNWLVISIVFIALAYLGFSDRRRPG